MYHRCLIANCNRFAVLPTIMLPLLPITVAAVHCNHVSAVHCDHCCRPSCITSNCAASALAAIVHHPSCHPLCHHHPVAHRNCAVPPPIVPLLLPIAAVPVHCNLAATIHYNLAATNLSLGSNCPPPIVPSIVPPQSHCPSQLLCHPAANCTDASHRCCRCASQSCRRCPS